MPNEVDKAEDFKAWLQRFDLAKYAELLLVNEVDKEILPELTEQDLAELGIPLGARKRLLRAVATLSADPGLDLHSGAAVETRSAFAQAERRQLTVMFCDIVGSTALSASLDPESMRDLLIAYREGAAQAVDRFGGYIANFIGDGLLIYFGYPQAHEDDPQRATRAALEIVDAVRAMNRESRWSQVELAVRVGVTTGLVVAGDIGTGEHSEKKGVVGEAPNIAARLQAIGTANTVTVGANTARLIEDFFVLEDLGPQQIKGVSERVRAFRVIGAKDVTTAFEARARRGLTPLVGRDEEIDLLYKRWQRASNGESSVVLVSGNPGIGKSRTVRGLQRRVENDRLNRILYFCSPYHANSAFYPITSQIERVLRFTRDDSDDDKVAKLEAMLDDLGLLSDEFASALAAFLSLPVGDRYHVVETNPQRSKQNILEILLAIVTAMAARAPVLLVAEDAHWMDPSTKEFLGFLIDQVRGVRLMMVVTFRAETAVPWHGRHNVVTLTLDRLSAQESRNIIASLDRDGGLSPAQVEQIIAKSDGVPLYVEELTKSVLESGALSRADSDQVSGHTQDGFVIPLTLQDSLTARLDRLSPEAKELLQIGAMLGRDFDHDLLAAVTAHTQQRLEELLEQLIGSELLYRRRLPLVTRYEFNHALIRDVAYDSLLRSMRLDYHRRIVAVLEKNFPDTVAAQPELLAHHCAQADLVESAIDYWEQAGFKACEKSANVEAINHFSCALELLEKQPKSDRRLTRELNLYIARGVPMIANRGWAAPEVEKNYTTAYRLSRKVGDHPNAYPALRGVWGFYLMRGELVQAQQMATLQVELARAQDDVELLLEAELALGMSLFWRGRFSDAQACFRSVEAFYHPDRHRSHAALFGTDPGVARRFYQARTMWYLGDPLRAVALSEEAVRIAEALSHPHSLAWARAFATSLYALCRDWEAARRCAEITIAYCTDFDFPFWLAWGKVLKGWTLAVQGEEKEGIIQLQQGLSAYTATGAGVAKPYFLSLLAETYGRTGQIEEALALLQDALVEANNNGNESSVADMLRLRGVLLSQCGSRCRDQALQALRQSVRIANEQQARLPELKAATELARLLADAHGRVEAADLLRSALDRFAEDDGFADLNEARTVLGQLS